MDDCIKGIVTRQQMQQAVLGRSAPEIHKAALCYPDQTVREIGSKFLESSAYVLVVVDRETKTVRGIITLHDLIRAQAAIHN